MCFYVRLVLFLFFQAGWGWWGSDISSKIQSVLNRLDGGTLLVSEQAYVDAMKKAFPL